VNTFDVLRFMTLTMLRALGWAMVLAFWAIALARFSYAYQALCAKLVAL
jgi:hypothetical protein